MVVVWVLIAVLVIGLGAGILTSFFILRFEGSSRFWATIAGTIVFFIVSLITFSSLQPYAFVDNYELGYVYDSRNGQIRQLTNTGYVGRVPFFENVHTIDLRPRQVCINVDAGGASGANSRVLNCKLVKFDPKGLGLFLSWHGRGDYSGSVLNDLLKIYAYDGSGRNYPFLNVLRELKDGGGEAPAGVVTNQTAVPQ